MTHCTGTVARERIERVRNVTPVTRRQPSELRLHLTQTCLPPSSLPAPNPFPQRVRFSPRDEELFLVSLKPIWLPGSQV